MHGKWSCLTYVDLFAGSGRSRIRGTKRIVPASPLIVLDNPAAFDRYVFCELDAEKAKALEARIGAHHRDRDTTIIVGDANDCIDLVLGKIPAKHSLCFAFADPFALSNLRFETIRRLSKRFVDHLILIPTGMDANRSIDAYYNKDSPVLDNFLGDRDWRPRWQAARLQGLSNDTFVVREFSQRMKRLGYIEPGVDQTHPILSLEKNLPLYRLAFYSRSPLAQRFWDQTRKYSEAQLTLFK